LARARGTVTVRDVMAATQLTIDAVFDALEPLARQHLIKPAGIEGLPGGPTPIQWFEMSAAEQAELRGRMKFGMTPLLPAALEGLLDYSPAADDRVVERVVTEATADIAPEDMDDPRSLLSSLDLPEPRASEAYERIARRTMPDDMRFRVTIELTLPNMTPEHSLEALQELLNAMQTHQQVKCTHVKLREAMTIETPLYNEG